MTEDNLNQKKEEENIDTSNPEAGSESEEALDIESLFSEEPAPEGEQPDDKVARLEKTVADLKKGIAKAFSEKGREKKAEEKPKTDKEDLAELFYAQKPEAELVDSDLQAVADAKYNGSILKAWKNEKWLQEKAKAMSEAKKVEEETKAKIKKPSNGTIPEKQDLSSVKPEDVHTLKPAEKAEWVKLQAEKERNNAD